MCGSPQGLSLRPTPLDKTLSETRSQRRVRNGRRIQHVKAPSFLLLIPPFQLDSSEALHCCPVPHPTLRRTIFQQRSQTWMKGQFELFLLSTISDAACLFTSDFLSLTTAAPIRGYGSAVLIYKVEERKEGPGTHSSLTMWKKHLKSTYCCSKNPVAAKVNGC